MKISKVLKDSLIEEMDFVISKMKKCESVENTLYYFSAIPGAIQRIINIEYTPDLLYAHSILQNTYQSFIQRLSAAKSGDSVRLTDAQLDALNAYTEEFIEYVEKGLKLDDMLKKFVILSFSTTGNGYYLMQKGVLKI